MPGNFSKDLQYYKFCLYGFLKNQRFFDPFILLFFLEKGITFFQIGVLFAIREISTNLFEVPSGMLADAIGRRRTMIMAFGFYIVSFILFYLFSGYLLFVAAMLFYSWGDAFRTGVHKAMIFNYLQIKGWGDQKVYYYGNTRSWSQMGSAVSSLIAAVIVITTGQYRTIFLFSTVPYLLDMALIASYPSVLEGKAGRLNWKDVGKNYAKVFRDFVYSFRKAGVLRAITNTSSFSGYYDGMKDYLQPVLESFALALPLVVGMAEKRRTALIVGSVYFLIFFLTAVASRRSGFFAGRFTNIRRPLNLTLVTGLALGLLSGVFYLAGWMIPAIACYVSIFVIENLRRPLGISYVADMLDRDILATALSAESQAKTLFAALLAMLMGFLAGRFGVGNALVTATALYLLLTPFFRAKKDAEVKVSG